MTHCASAYHLMWPFSDAENYFFLPELPYDPIQMNQTETHTNRVKCFIYSYAKLGLDGVFSLYVNWSRLIHPLTAPQYVC